MSIFEKLLNLTIDAIEDIGGEVNIDQVNQWFVANKTKAPTDVAGCASENENGILVIHKSTFEMAVKHVYKNGRLPVEKADRLMAELRLYLLQQKGKALSDACCSLLDLVREHTPRILGE